jgi:carboxyl-terminal processing protease
LKLTTAKYYTPSGRCIHKEHPAKDEEASAEPDEEGNAPDPKKPQDGVKLDQKKNEAPSPTETFKTVGGRTVMGGGGITPDIVVQQPEMTQFTIDVERKNFFFTYAIKWVARHPQAKDFKVTPEVAQEFRQMLVDDKFTYTQAAWDSNATYVERGLRREVARRQHGTNAAYMVSIEGDEQLKKTLDLFNHGRTVKDFYAVTAAELKPMSTETMKRSIR